MATWTWQLNTIRIKIRFFRTQNPLTVPLEKSKVKEGYRLCDLLTNAEVSNLLQTIEPDSLGMILNKGNFVPIPKALNPHGEAQLEMIKKLRGGKYPPKVPPGASH